MKMNALKGLKNKIQGKKSDKKDKEAIKKLEDFDILLGRGKTSFNHVGNRRFRVFIGLHLRRYMEASSRMEKTLVVNSVVEAIQEGGGRFLKQDLKTEKWYQVNPKMAREKVGHALRDAVGMRMKIANGSQSTKSHERRASDIIMERARRSSVSEVQAPNFSKIQLPQNEMKRISKSCNNLTNGPGMTTSFRGNSSLAIDARKALLELGEDGTADRSPQNSGVPQLRIGKVTSEDSTARKNNLSEFHSMLNAGRLKSEDPNSDLHSDKISLYSDGDNTKMSQVSTELSVMSDGTNKKWFDLESGEFSVDSKLFDDDSQCMSKEMQTNTPSTHLVEKVSKALSGFDLLQDDSQSTSKHSNVASARRKTLPTRKSGNSLSADVDLSEDFSVMSISKSITDEIKLDGLAQSEEFGLKSEEFLKNNNTKSEEFGLKSDEFLKKSEEFGLKSEDFLKGGGLAQQAMMGGITQRGSSSEMSIRSRDFTWMRGSSTEMGRSKEFRNSASSEFLSKVAKAADIQIVPRSAAKVTWDDDKDKNKSPNKVPEPAISSVPEGSATAPTEERTSAEFSIQSGDSGGEWKKTLEALAT